MEFIAIGINHRDAPIEMREKFAFSNEICTGILEGLKDKSLIEEGLYLATCNRCEMYALSGAKLKDPAELKAILCSKAGVSSQLAEKQWYMKRGFDAVHHLFRVTASLDAMVVGETQILNQVKNAYLNALQCKTTGPFLNRTLLRAIYAAKKVHSETNIAKGSVSVASVAVDLARQCIGNLSDITVLAVGTGEIGALVIKHLKKHGAKRIIISNRTFEKAELIAAHINAESLPWSNLTEGIASSHVVICSTGSDVPVIDKKLIKNALGLRKEKIFPCNRPLLLIDLGSPRDIAEDISALNNVTVFNIDDLKRVAKRNNEQRIREAKKAEELVVEETRRFFSETGNPELNTAIAMLNLKFEEIRGQELRKTLSHMPHLSDNDKHAFETCTRSITDKILNHPLRKIKKTDNSDIERLLLSEVLFQLFHLDEE